MKKRRRYAWGRVNLDGNAILASLFVGLVGAALFVYGKRQGRFPQMLVGVAMVLYPYFVPNVIAMLAIAAGLILALLVTVRLGY
jgi:hypothetical protein